MPKADYKAEVMRRMMADRATPHTVTGQSPDETLFGRKMKIGCILPQDQQYHLRNNKTNKAKKQRRIISI